MECVPPLQCWVSMSLELWYLIARRFWVHFQLRSLSERSACSHAYVGRLRSKLGLGLGQEGSWIIPYIWMSKIKDSKRCVWGSVVVVIVVVFFGFFCFCSWFTLSVNWNLGQNKTKQNEKTSQLLAVPLVLIIFISQRDKNWRWLRRAN